MTRSNRRVWTLSAIWKAAIRSPVPNRPDASCSRTRPSNRLSRLPSMIKIAAAAIPDPARECCDGGMPGEAGIFSSSMRRSALAEAVPDDGDAQRGEQAVRDWSQVEGAFDRLGKSVDLLPGNSQPLRDHEPAERDAKQHSHN